ncbi:MAG: FtsW/RodA/SpoVE family cell cycle protein [Oscillospiraceae bacterium]|nr:FtsW/RodA/SpoVE family cell cycle protein [Oscillospiraceae bacterium]
MEILNSISEFFGMTGDAGAAYSEAAKYVVLAIRILLPILAIFVLYRCAASLFYEKPEKEVWAYLTLPNGGRIELTRWENVIGRARSSDVALEYPTLSRSHAAFIRDASAHWIVHDLDSKGGITVNGDRVDGCADIENGDMLSLAGVDMLFLTISEESERKQARSRRRPGEEISPSLTLFALTLFQLFLMAELVLSENTENEIPVIACFGGLSLVMWLYYGFMRVLGRTGIEIETLGFFLCTIGMSVVASSVPGSLYKQIIIDVAGIFVFLIIGWLLRDLNRAKKLRWPIAAAGIALLAVNVLLAKTTFGARNWLSIAGISLQPSELVKICFVFAGSAALDRLFAKRNIFLFIIYSAVCVGALALISDFDTAAIFFVCYLVIAFMRSGDFAAVFLSVGGAGLAGFLAITVKPYIKSRFATWGKAWQYVNAGGYQQTRTMAALASGGLLGVGAGNGWLKGVFAADTDMVFGMVAEELGYIIALCIIAALILIAFFAVRSSYNARSSFYIIGACAAVSIMLAQTILNVFGSLDILPFTGVTLPFVSKGGSSMLSCWGLLAFIKAVDTRQNASFAIKLPKKYRRYSREEEAYTELDAWEDFDTEAELE